MKTYKLVWHQADGKRYSCCKNTLVVDSDNRVEYKINEYVGPRQGYENSLLFSFKTLTDAKRFRDEEFYSSYNLEIWECEVKGISKYGRRAMCGRVKTFWDALAKIKARRKKIDILKIDGASSVSNPYGTVFSKQIKLIKQVA